MKFQYKNGIQESRAEVPKITEKTQTKQTG